MIAGTEGDNRTRGKRRANQGHSFRAVDTAEVGNSSDPGEQLELHRSVPAVQIRRGNGVVGAGPGSKIRISDVGVTPGGQLGMGRCCEPQEQETSQNGSAHTEILPRAPRKYHIAMSDAFVERGGCLRRTVK